MALRGRQLEGRQNMMILFLQNPFKAFIFNLTLLLTCPGINFDPWRDVTLGGSLNTEIGIHD